ncbi:hypothetical protein C0J52_07538 [Blattella germanica]|nr:hypothetical protein C0J52_07538 [Blattella germanica]
MGEFQRSRSKVWWSNYIDADTEDEEPRHVTWGGAGLVLSPSRGSSSSPSSSHKSQDSGFSDSEASTSPGSNGELKSSPLPAERVDRNESPDHKSDEDEVIENQICESSDEQSKDAGTVISNEQNIVQPKSPVKKLKGQFLSQCGCLGQNSTEDNFNTCHSSVQEIEQNACTDSSNNNVDSSSQLPVKKLREKFLQDCICLNQVSTDQQGCHKDSCHKEKSIVDKSKSPQKSQSRQNTTQPLTQQQVKLDTDNEIIQCSQNKVNVGSISEQGAVENSVIPTPSSPPELQSRPASSLTRAVPVPKIRTPQKNQTIILKESSVSKSPTPSPRRVKNECQNPSPIASPRSSKNNLKRSQCQSDAQCSEINSPLNKTEDSLNNSQLSPKQNNENANSSNQSTHRKDYPKNQSESLSLQCSAQSSKCEQSVLLSGVVSDRKDCSSANSVSSIIPQQLGSPTHTSTPKTSSTTPNKLFTTPSRALRCLGLGKKQGRPVNLLNNFNSNQQPENPDSEKGPVQQWLGELSTLYEPECMTTLQSKSLAIDLSHQVALMAATATDTVKMLQDSTKLISTEFTKLCQQLEYGKMEHVGPLVQSLVGHVSEFLQEYCNKEKGTNNADEKKLVEICDRLRLIAAKQPPDKEEITSEITCLGNTFTNIVDKTLSQHISVLVGMLEEPTSNLALRSALSSLTALGLEGPHLSRLVAQCSGIRALLAVCLESQSSTIRTAALRALATICCVVEAIRQLEQVSNTASSETLLLAAAALANLTFMEPRTVWPLLEYETAGKLLQAVKKRGPKVSVFLQEQAATLIANMAAVPESRPHLADQRAVVALLLCSDPVVAAQVVELQGVNRLVRLCKEERERNHSDGVLVACLAALRKIAANCGTKVIEDLDAMELVEPRLLDSFLIYSSRQESYV